MMSIRPAIIAAAFLAAALFAVVADAAPAPLVARDGWVVMQTAQTFEALSTKLEQAIAAKGMNLVNSASASAGAKAQGIVIPGNRVVGVFRTDFARRMLQASLPAGIEAPIRFYLTETPEGTAILSWRKPGAVFAPYYADAGPDLRKLAEELDSIFADIAAEATRP